MKLMLKVSCIVAGSLFIAVKLQAQDFENLIKGSTKDANYLVEGYLSPALKAFGTGFNQGWYNTAKPHKKFGFDLTISVTGVQVPSSDKFFTVDNSQLQEISLTKDHTGSNVGQNGSGRIPTFFGPADTQGTFEFSQTSSSFDAIGGVDLKEEIGIDFLPIPVYNLGFGLPKSIEIKFRFIPSFKRDNTTANLFGFGVMHDVKQYIPGLKMFPFDLSVFAGYTKLSINRELDGPSQTGEFSVSSTTIQGLVSKKISVLTVYGGVGYDFTKSTLAAKGNYDLDDDPSNGNEAKDPLNLNVSQTGPRVTAGIRLKFAFFTLHGDYTLQKYNAFSAGFGINVR